MARPELKRERPTTKNQGKARGGASTAGVKKTKRTEVDSNGLTDRQRRKQGFKFACNDCDFNFDRKDRRTKHYELRDDEFAAGRDFFWECMHCGEKRCMNPRRPTGHECPAKLGQRVKCTVFFQRVPGPGASPLVTGDDVESDEDEDDEENEAHMENDEIDYDQTNYENTNNSSNIAQAFGGQDTYLPFGSTQGHAFGGLHPTLGAASFFGTTETPPVLIGNQAFVAQSSAVSDHNSTPNFHDNVGFSTVPSGARNRDIDDGYGSAPHLTGTANADWRPSVLTQAAMLNGRLKKPFQTMESYAPAQKVFNTDYQDTTMRSSASAPVSVQYEQSTPEGVADMRDVGNNPEDRNTNPTYTNENHANGDYENDAYGARSANASWQPYASNNQSAPVSPPGLVHTGSPEYAAPSMPSTPTNTQDLAFTQHGGIAALESCFPCYLGYCLEHFCACSMGKESCPTHAGTATRFV